MSKAYRDSFASVEQCKAGPDFFSFYAREIADLLSQNESTLSASSAFELSRGKYEMFNGKEAMDCSHKDFSSLFGNSIDIGFSDLQKGKLKALLRQSVKDLSLELDETLDPVVAMCQLRYKLKSNNMLTAASNGIAAQVARKKPKMSSCSPTSISADSCPKRSGSCEEVKDDLQFLIENDNPLLVDQIVKKYADELSSTLLHMELKLEQILDTIMRKCRPMTLTEKQKLRELIQKLPLENLDRVVEIIQRGRPAAKPCGEEIFVDLEREKNVTLWRLYYYVEAVEKAKTLAQSKF